VDTPRPSPRTNRTRRVPHPVLSLREQLDRPPGQTQTRSNPRGAGRWALALAAQLPLPLALFPPLGLAAALAALAEPRAAPRARAALGVLAGAALLLYLAAFSLLANLPDTVRLEAIYLPHGREALYHTVMKPEPLAHHAPRGCRAWASQTAGPAALTAQAILRAAPFPRDGPRVARWTLL